MMGLLSGWIESLDYEYEVLSFCTRQVSPHSKCLKCVESCDKKAISIINDRPVINHEKCIECARCISACPVQAIAGIYPKRMIFQDQLVITDKSVPTAKELLIFHNKGIRKIVGETQASIELWKEVIEEANVILEQLNELPFLIEIKLIEKNETLTRRELFSFWKNEGKNFVKQAVPAKWRFNQADLDMQKYYKDYQFSSITIDIEKCTLCSACQQLCKKRCFEILDRSFSISAQGCSDCQLCVDACPENAIKIESQISQKQNIIFPIHTKICNKCCKEFNTLREYDDLCISCLMQNRFGSI
ncbi:4Fe-4S dicluster domain-containing protein [Bacillus massiliigorillae]|uniref:4Fe-4S dicluster domain-containing protein n=1 Tax=Bacillus massiliigorillae TaxID=1243664 RepID=UPI001E2C50CB|nr:4Fe-4S dicluster domain-containing protein [Bacillus massiliigorillae]